MITSLNSQPTVNNTHATPEYFQLTAAPLALGRHFDAGEAMDTHNPVAILSYRTWQQYYGGQPDILEQKVSLSGVSYRIVGVTAERFVEPQLAATGRETHIWLPWDYEPAPARLKQSFSNILGRLYFAGKLKPGITPSQAEQQLTPLVNDKWQAEVAGQDFFSGWSVKMELMSFKARILGESDTIALMLLAGVIGLVLIACANISNLFMSRTAEQQQQLAIQAAVGATRGHLFKALLAETGLLMLLSTVLALLVAMAGFLLLQSYLNEVLPRVDELTINAITVASAVLIAALFALFFAKLSSNMINYRALNTMLQSSGKGTGIQVSRKTRQTLIASQVALATVLVFANISLFQDAMKTINTPIGFTTDNIATLSLSISTTTENRPSEEEDAPIIAEIARRLSELPAVEAISNSRSPLSGFGLWAITSVETNTHYTPLAKSADHRYFQLIEQPLLQGDYFTEADIKDGARKMIVNEHFARKLTPDGNALGMQIDTGGDNPRTITGIVKGINLPDSEADSARVYVPEGTDSYGFMLKLKPGQTLSREQIAAVLKEVDTRYSVFFYEQTGDMHLRGMFTQVTTAATTAVLTLLVFFLAGIGLYGILSYSTQLRRFELGTRMAIGAQRKHLVGLIVRDNGSSVLWGLAVSAVIVLLGYLGFTDVLADYLSLALVPALMLTLALILGIALFACYWPLRQFINKPAVYSLRGSE